MRRGMCLVGLECGGHSQEEQPLTLLVEWFFWPKKVSLEKLLTMKCRDGDDCFRRVLECN